MRRTRTDGAHDGARPTTKARVVALRLLAQRRLTESQLWARLERRGYLEEDVREAVASCKRDGFIDDHLFAQLFIDGRMKAVGDARLVAELVKRGIDRDAAKASVSSAERLESERLDLAIEKLFRTRSSLNLPNAARALERLGFPASAIYRQLRSRAQAEFAHDDAIERDRS
ncbi:MAG: hypothetical protein NVS2B3_06670 [Vulcanimicrobiaceae bacterium]